MTKIHFKLTVGNQLKMLKTFLVWYLSYHIIAQYSSDYESTGLVSRIDKYKIKVKKGIKLIMVPGTCSLPKI